MPFGLGRIYAQLSYGELPAQYRDEVRAGSATANTLRSTIDEFAQASDSVREAAALRDFGPQVARRPDGRRRTRRRLVDLHQIGAGFGGHFWFTHGIANNPSGPTKTADLTDTVPKSRGCRSPVPGRRRRR